jgi:tRNA-2-methylthio-N6-dimethylallyladenosine synthase
MNMSNRRVHIETWGCQMNVADSERMLALLAKHSFEHTKDPSDADLIILNTCNIREKARHKVLTRLGELREIKLQNPALLLALSGCVAQAESESLRKELPFLDLIFGPDHIEELPNLLSRAVDSKITAQTFANPGPLTQTEFQEENTYTIPSDTAEPWIDTEKFEASKFVNIIKGCNNYCTYCVVPFTRGREKSRPVEEIENEIHFLLGKGIKEIVLLGQNVNSYGLDNTSNRIQELEHTPFLDLLEHVGAIPGIERLRFVTSNPHDFPKMMPSVFQKIPILCDQLHLPVQSGSNAVLTAMNRKYTREDYLQKIESIRKVRPEMAFSTDIIVGFPGETDEDFEATLSLVKEVRYSSLFAFKYSPRKLTAAARFKNRVPENIQNQRLQAILNFQQEESERQNKAEIGRERDVFLVYRPSKPPHYWHGRTFQGRLVRILDAEGVSGDTVRVRIESANATSLEARIIR